MSKKTSCCRQFLVVAIFTGLFLTVLAPFVLAKTYPQLDITGYKKYEYTSYQVTPQTNFYLAQPYLDRTYSYTLANPWRERLRLNVVGKLSEELSVAYDLQQEPDLPEKYNIKVKYNQHELAFGDFTTKFTGNEFALATKSLNGVMITSKTNDYEFNFSSGKVRSNTQKWTSQRGRNTRGPYSLGRGSIVDGSEKIELNNVRLVRNQGYTIDYFEGKVTFKQILSSNDEIRYTYEYTSILELFFPTLSQRSFFGLQARAKISPALFQQKPPTKTKSITYQVSEIFPSPQVTPTIEGESEKLPELVTLTTEEAEWETVGVYHLKKTPIVPYSEKIFFLRRLLKKDEDYSINYQDGSLILFTLRLPSQEHPLTVDYEYYETEYKAETIIGRDSRGPYQLGYKPIISGSEKISIDGKVRLKNIEYTINYLEGTILFTNQITSTSIIQASYQRVKVITPPPPPPVAKYPAVTVGTTYLRETAKQSTTSPTATMIETKTGQSIIDNNSIFQLSHFPLDEDATVTVKINNSLVTKEVDYSFPSTEAGADGVITVTPPVIFPFINDPTDASDGYDAGTIKFLHALQGTDEVAIIYTYLRSVSNRYVGTGNGSRGPYYLGNTRSMMVGSETVQIWKQGETSITTLTRNASIEPDTPYYVHSGDYVINYTDFPYIYFNDPLPDNYNFALSFNYIPTRTGQQSELSRDVIGVDTTLDLGKPLKLTAAYAQSQSDQVFLAVSDSDTKTGTNSRGPYTLSKKPIIEGTEMVYVNDELKTKDVDYYINYSSGRITFYYITLTPSDTLKVDYEYQDPGGVPAGEEKAVDKAYKISANSQLGPVTLGGDYKVVGPKFTPLTTSYVGAGSEYKSYRAGYKPHADFSVAGEYKDTQNPLSEKGYYLHNYERIVSTRWNPLKLATINVKFRQLETIDDTLPTVATTEAQQHTRDTLVNQWTASLNPKKLTWNNFSFTNQNNFSLSEALTDTVDKQSATTTKNTFWRTRNSLGIGRFATLTFDYQLSEPITSTSEAETAHSLIRDYTYNISWDFTFKPLQKLQTRWRLLTHDQEDLINKKKYLTRNESYHLDFVPTKMISTRADHSRQENLSTLVRGANPKTERTTYNVRATPHKTVNTNWTNAYSISLHENGNESTSLTNTTTLNYAPVPQLRFDSRLNQQDTETHTFTGTKETFWTDYNLNEGNLNTTYKPFSALTLSTKLGQKDNKKHNLTSFADTYDNRRGVSITFSPLKQIAVTTGGENATTNLYNKTSTSTSTRETLTGKRNLKVTLRPTSLLSFSSQLNQESNDSTYQTGGTQTLTTIISDSKSYAITLYPLKILTLTGGITQVGTNTRTGSAETDVMSYSNQYTATLVPASNLTIKANYNFKRTINRTALTESPREIVGANLTYKISRQGAFTYDYKRELNQGEIQRDEVTGLPTFKTQNFIREIHSVGFNLTIPQSNVILTSIVFKASWKAIRYNDFLNTNNSFVGSLLAFEGTLNF